MQLLLVSVCLALFCSALTSASDPHYVITAPSHSVEGSTQKVCVTFLGLDGPVDFKLDLHKDEHTHVIAEHKVDTPDYSHCFPFQVPAAAEDFSVWSLHAVVHGEHLNVNETKTIVIIKGHDACYIQTDKATYKPGDTVRFRVISVDADFHPAPKTFPVIELKDPNQNRIGQWLNAPVNHGIADFTFPLSNELSFGVYNIAIPSECTKHFTVSEYELKRFELHLNVPSSIAVIDKSFHLETCGSYTYGKPVHGSVNLTVCLVTADHAWQTDSSSEEDGGHSEKCIKLQDVKTDSKGCLSKEIDLSFFKLSRETSEYLKMSSSLTEDGTGHIETASAEAYFNKFKSITFMDPVYYYTAGAPFHAKVRVVDEKKQPMANTTVSIYQDGKREKIAGLVTDSNGIAHCTLNTSEWDSYMSLTAKISSDDGEEEDYRRHWAETFVVSFYSESHSFVSPQSKSEKIPCDSDLPVTVEYDINGLDPKDDHLTFFYFLLSKDGINSYKEHKLDLKEHVKDPRIHGSFALNIHVDKSLAPIFAIFIFTILPKGETVVGRAEYKVSDCSKNKVHLSFSEAQVHPGENVNLKVTADSGSWCSVRSVDKGFLLHAPHEDSLSDVLSRDITELIGSRTPGYYHPMSERDRITHQCPENETAIHNVIDLQLDAFIMFELHNLKMFTNTRVSKPPTCVPIGFAGRSSVHRKKEKSTKEKDQELKKPHTRGYFPDTWLFDLVSVGPEGHTELNLTTPDSITKWVTDAVCLGNSGIGEIKDVGLTTFQPYFIDLILPYSVVQGETFTIQALVFNYVKSCVLVVVSLSDSEDFLTVQKKEQARCICEGQSTHFTWEATAIHIKNLKIHVSSGSLQLEGECTEDSLLLGKDHREDSIEKTVVVKARGHEEQKTETFLLYPADTSEKIHVSFHVPERFVPGSARTHMIVLGDLMGNIVINLDNVVYMADGCGEQNIAKLSRYVYTMQYLQSTKELTPELKEKGVKTMTENYQRQLTFKNENGSYGGFPDGPGNFWITALVLKTLSNAQDFIPIDQTIIQQAVTWLQNKQLPNGCFNESVHYFNNDLEAENIVANTAYVVISLLEHHVVCNGSIVENALKCLRKEAHSITSPYTQALLAYAFTLAGDSELRQEALKHLDKTAIKKEAFKHWETTVYKQVDVETSAYVILALLSEKTTAQKDVEESADIVRYILTLQNPWGGFYSSQDSTVGIQALAKYAKATHHKKGAATVTVESKSGFHKEIHVDKENSVLLQTVVLPEFPGEYTVTATGKGCVYLQSHLHYNSLPDHSDDHFSVNVSTQPAVCTHEAQTNFELHVDVRYTGKRPETNMAMVVVEFLSGFVPDKKSIKKLEENPIVKRTEISASNVTIYLDKLTHKDEHFVFVLNQETHVTNLHPANVAVYDYYVPDVHDVEEYNSPCNAMKGHCEVGVSQRTDCGHPGITKEECEQKGCCYDSSITQSKWCFFQGFEKEESH
ncbi:alpha-2-macroglobulin-like [Pseudophryne corroboree]|uniref:alpha-2-macroglobulin-like n=1 Tax=Pseudophryne corroboree TaxID=495146 RepID=UPI003081BE80